MAASSVNVPGSNPGRHVIPTTADIKAEDLGLPMLTLGVTLLIVTGIVGYTMGSRRRHQMRRRTAQGSA
jgi:hypothetical protein